MTHGMLSRILFYSAIFLIFAGPLSAQSAPAAGITTPATVPEIKLD
jgi:hypothetical protein